MYTVSTHYYNTDHDLQEGTLAAVCRREGCVRTVHYVHVLYRTLCTVGIGRRKVWGGCFYSRREE